jgi:Polynucleotide kinase 3 phosphatase
MGSHLVIHYNTLIDLSGRVKEGSRKKDFADTDLKLALNACIQFQTPEKFFLGSNQALHTQFNVTDSVRLCDVVRQKNEIFQWS